MRITAAAAADFTRSRGKSLLQRISLIQLAAVWDSIDAFQVLTAYIYLPVLYH